MVQVDQPEEHAARDVLQAVLAAGEGGLEGAEIDDLGQRQGNHGEVDPLAADGQAAEDETERPCAKGAGQNAQLRRQAAVLDQIPGHVGRSAEEGGMAEGEQPGVA